MAVDETHTCEGCRGGLDTSESGVVYAVELSLQRTLDEEPVEGREVLFHRRCWSPSLRYRRTL